MSRQRQRKCLWWIYGRWLFDSKVRFQLSKIKESQQRKEEEFAAQAKLMNTLRGLNQEELDFLDTLEAKDLQKRRSERQKVQSELLDYRRAVEEQVVAPKKLSQSAQKKSPDFQSSLNQLIKRKVVSTEPAEEEERVVKSHKTEPSREPSTPEPKKDASGTKNSLSLLAVYSDDSDA